MSDVLYAILNTSTNDIPYTNHIKFFEMDESSIAYVTIYWNNHGLRAQTVLFNGEVAIVDR